MKKNRKWHDRKIEIMNLNFKIYIYMKIVEKRKIHHLERKNKEWQGERKKYWKENSPQTIWTWGNLACLANRIWKYEKKKTI